MSRSISSLGAVMYGTLHAQKLLPLPRFPIRGQVEPEAIAMPISLVVLLCSTQNIAASSEIGSMHEVSSHKPEWIGLDSLLSLLQICCRDVNGCACVLNSIRAMVNQPGTDTFCRKPLL